MHPEGKTLRLLIRAPLKSMRDIDIPTVAGGFLDFSKMEAAERHAAQVWIRDFVELYENGQQLTVPVIAATRTSLPSDRSFESYDAALANITTGAEARSEHRDLLGAGHARRDVRVSDSNRISRTSRFGRA